MADIFDEVSEDLRAERASALARRYGWVLVMAVLLVLAGVGGWQFWRARQAAAAQAVAGQFLDAMRKAEGAAGAIGQTTPQRQEAAEEFARLAATAPEGYRTLARLRAAALKAEAGDLPAALKLWDEVAADGAAEKRLRDLASLLWVQHQIDAGDPAVLEARLRPLQAPDGTWRALAEESEAWLALRTGQVDKAKEGLRRLLADTSVPGGVGARARLLLEQMGEPLPAPPAQGVPPRPGIGG